MNKTNHTEKIKELSVAVINWMIRIVFYILLFILFLVLLLYLPPIQQFIAGKVERILADKTQTTLQVEAIRLNFNGKLLIRGIYLEDLEEDTLLYADRIKVDVSLPKLLTKTVEIREMELSDVHSKIFINPENRSSNFDFLIQAFSSQNKIDPDSVTGSKWKITFGNLLGEKIQLKLKIEKQMTIRADFGEILLMARKNDLNRMIFENDRIRIANTSIALKIDRQNEYNDESSENNVIKPLIATAGNLSLENIHVVMSYDHRIRLNVNIHDFAGKDNYFDLGEHRITNSQTLINNSQIELELMDSIQTDQDSFKDRKKISWPFADFEWNIASDKIELDHMLLSMHKRLSGDSSRILPHHHLELSDLSLLTGDLYLDNQQFRTRIEKFQFGEKKGFRLNKLSADLSARPDQLQIRDLKLETGRSVLHATLETDTRLLTDPSAVDQECPFILRIGNSWISQRDLDDFIPENPMEKYHVDSLGLHLSAHGKLNRINLEELYIQTNQGTHLSGRGSIKNIVKKDRLLFNIRIKEFFTSMNELIKFVPKIYSFKTYLPEKLTASGELNGSVKNMNADLNFQTASGNIGISADYQANNFSQEDTIGLTFRIDHYDLHDFFRNDSLKYISLDGQAGISGIQTKQLKAAADLNISSLEFSGTAFNNLKLTGNYDPGQASLRLISHDPALELELTGAAIMEDSIMNFDVSSKMTGVDLKNLGISRNPLFISTNMNAKGRIDQNEINGSLKVNSITITGSENIDIKEIRMDFLTGGDSTYLNLNSENISTYFSSNISASEIPVRLKQFILESVNGSETASTPGQGKIQLEIRFKEPLEKFTEVFPDFKIVYPDHITMEFDEAKSYLSAEMGVPVFDYRSIKLDSLDMNFLIDRGDFNYRVDAEELAINSLDISNLSLQGVRKDTLLINRFIKKDSLGTEVYYVEIDLTASPERDLYILLNPEKLMLDGNDWTVSDDSRMVINRNHNKEGRIQISRGKQQVIFEIVKDSLYTLAVRQFDLDYFSDFIGGDQFKMGGILDMESEMVLKDSLTWMQANLNVADFIMNGTELGILKAGIRDSGKEGIALDIQLKNQKNKILAKGTYHPGAPEIPLNLILDLDINSLADFETFGNGMLTNLEGTVSGNARLEGNKKNFRIDGEISLDGVGFFSKQLNNRYRIENEKLIVKNNQLQLKDFTITDSLLNNFKIDGYVNFLRMKDINYNLHILADRFTIYNATEKENGSLYGQLILSADARATGSLTSPKLNLKLTAENGTDMTYVLPPQEINLVSYDEIVEFEVPDELDSSQLVIEKNTITDTIFSRFEGIDLESNLIVNDQAQFKLVIDPGSGDYITVKGRGDLNLRYQQGSDAFVSGVYTLSEGEYRVSFYGLVQKSFTIQNGSTVTWTGDPDNARVNITASHVLRTASSGLVAAETMGMTEDEMRQYRKTLPYEVKIYMTGTFQKPEFKFSIDLIDEDRAAYPLVISKLNRINSPGYESQLTQQVFGLLTIGSFIPEQTIDTGTGYGAALATTAAANSLNGILTRELNKLSGKYLQGIDIDIGMQTSSQMSSGTSTTQTTMDVRFSKNFYNDRITIEAETSFDVGGDKYLDPTGYNYSNFQSDFAFKYDLTPKGDYKLKVFNKSSYDIIYKDIRTTGFAIIFVKDFDKIADIKRGNKKKGQQNDK
jgi:translocation and assembly module TamB